MVKCLVAGSTGLVGQFLLKQLSEDGQFDEIHALARREGSVDKHPRVIERLVNFDELDLDGLSVDVVFCSLGTTMKRAGSKQAFYRVDHDYILEVAKKGLEAGAKQFILVSSIGANPASQAYYLKVKGTVEFAIRDLEYERVSILRPSLLKGPRAEYRMGERIGEIALGILKPLMIGSMKKQVPVHVSQVAACMIDATKENTAGTFYYDSNMIRAYTESSL